MANGRSRRRKGRAARTIPSRNDGWGIGQPCYFRYFASVELSIDVLSMSVLRFSDTIVSS
jgi:hypothetical protein